MPLNDDGVPCENAGVWEKVGIEKVQVGITKIKKGRGYREEPVFQEKPVMKQFIRKVPLAERGWSREVTYEKPVYNRRAGTVDVVQYRYSSDHFVCSVCGTNRHTMLRLMGWSPTVHTQTEIKGAGVYRRCGKCDVTLGPIAEEKPFCEVETIERGVNRQRALELVRKYGLQMDTRPFEQ